MAIERENIDLETSQALEQPAIPAKDGGFVKNLTKHVRGIATACLGLLSIGGIGCEHTPMVVPFVPETFEKQGCIALGKQVQEETIVQPTKTFEGISVTEGKLELGSTPSIEELKQMYQSEYFQQPEGDYSIATDKQFEGTPPEGTKSEELLKFESEIYQSKENFHVGEAPDVPNEGKFSLPPMK